MVSPGGVGVFMKSRCRRNLCIGLLLLVLVAVFLYNAGRLLVVKDAPQEAELIVVLMGSGPDRMLGAVDLYKQGYADHILMVENCQSGFELLEPRGVELPRDAEVAAMAAVQLGVPEEALVILPGDACSTQDEALIVAQYVQENAQIKTVLLVTSSYHSLRSAQIFRWALGRSGTGSRVLSCPTPYDNFEAEKWWRSREHAKSVMLEYAKLINFYLVDRWRESGDCPRTYSGGGIR